MRWEPASRDISLPSSTAPERSLRRLDLAVQLELATRELHRLRPAAVGKARAAPVCSWSPDANARGAYAFFGPGQITAWQQELS